MQSFTYVVVRFKPKLKNATRQNFKHTVATLYIDNLSYWSIYWSIYLYQYWIVKFGPVYSMYRFDWLFYNSKFINHCFHVCYLERSCLLINICDVTWTCSARERWSWQCRGRILTCLCLQVTLAIEMIEGHRTICSCVNFYWKGQVKWYCTGIDGDSMGPKSKSYMISGQILTHQLYECIVIKHHTNENTLRFKS